MTKKPRRENVNCKSGQNNGQRRSYLFIEDTILEVSMVWGMTIDFGVRYIWVFIMKVGEFL